MPLRGGEMVELNTMVRSDSCLEKKNIQCSDWLKTKCFESWFMKSLLLDAYAKKSR